MTITNGEVSFEQSRKLAEYENRKVGVTFNATNEGGVEDEARKALDLAESLVMEKLGYKTAPLIGRPPGTPQPDGAKIAVGENIKKRAPKAAKSAPAKDPDPADVSALEGGTEPPPANISTGEPRQDPANPDPADVSTDFAAEPEEVTDKALTEATTRKNAELIKSLGSEGTVKIRKLIGTFVTHPKGLTDIPADSRAEYLKKLGELKG